MEIAIIENLEIALQVMEIVIIEHQGILTLRQKEDKKIDLEDKVTHEKNGWKQLDINFSSSHQQIGMKLRSTQPENSAQITFSEFIKSNKPKESKPIEFKQPKLNKYNFIRKI